MNTSIKNILAQRQLDTPEEIWPEKINSATTADVEKYITATPGTYSLAKLAALISPAAANYLEQMAQLAHNLTVQRFGKTIQIYAPLYLSNICINNCIYCGFNAKNKFNRTRLTIEDALAEADIIAQTGIKDILLVSGEDKDFITTDYLVELASKLRNKFSSISIEIYPMIEAEYKKLFTAGIEGITLYQETYDRSHYATFHPKGPKSDYDWRLETHDRAAKAGLRQIGLGSLLGLTDWRLETLALAEHAHYLMKKYWQSRISFSFPRLRPAHDVASQFKHIQTDKELVQMMLALRLCFADAGLVISTREPANLRNHLVQLGATRISAGSKTNPGGYSENTSAIQQFEIDDDRTPQQICQMLKNQNLDPVLKDWDKAFIAG